ncbi:MAG: TIGR04211 family SH3 domain-containing protein [Methylococcales bacterium]|nr:TIGR04211 family SH3 domain-containing protein [Methylococcales bacterium]
MKKIIPALALLFISAAAEAETVYTVDSVDFPFRANEDTRSKIVAMIPGGTELTVLHRNTRSGFSKVKTSSGAEGYIISRNLTPTPGTKVQVNELNLKLAALIEENNIIKAELSASKGDNTQALTPNQSLLDERDRAKQELAELKIASTQTVQLKEQRDQLQERNIAIERELEQIKRENQAYQNTSNQDWFLYGGALALAGILLGFLLPKMAWKRKSSGWDTF